MRSWLKWILLAVVVIVLVAFTAARYRQVLEFLGNPEQIRAWLVRLGPLGPLGLIAFNALQVVVAPIPGYPIQIAAGYLFGWWRGSLYATVGMILGGLLAMTLARVYGRPLVERVVGVSRLERWEQVAHLNSLAVWFVLMLGPLGDAPYYIAGLTRLSVWKLLVIVLLVRTPSVMVSAALGAGLISWRSPWFLAGATLFIISGILAALNEHRIEAWLNRKVRARLGNTAEDAVLGGESPKPSPEAVQEMGPDASGPVGSQPGLGNG
jgi:uncharacterized membrane protein YdjX (TVP38/TMEM64 family)